ncbi:uncharacterized protein LOC126323774 [Schistocerca gregaria]|uniref:uncharacterized protein LOC126323774 n=1 Tax=Schistocerca gregaria TaxID=7010 RepID=UPI00211E6551|nr:uncharacterized protein LOC126323774 [Schistocerca gregaria]
MSETIPAGVSAADTAFLNLFWQLALDDPIVRARATAVLVQTLLNVQTSQGDQLRAKFKKNSPELDYTLKRLTKGLASEDKTACLGFATALVEILTYIETDLSDLIQTTFETVMSKKNEISLSQRQLVILLTTTAMIRSKRLQTISERKLNSLLDKLSSQLVTYLNLKHSPYSEFTVRVIRDLAEIVPKSIWTNFASTFLPFLSVDSIQAISLTAIFHTISECHSSHEASPALLSDENLPKISDALAQCVSSFPRVHSVWNYLLDYCMSSNRTTRLNILIDHILKTYFSKKKINSFVSLGFSITSMILAKIPLDTYQIILKPFILCRLQQCLDMNRGAPPSAHSLFKQLCSAAQHLENSNSAVFLKILQGPDVRFSNKVIRQPSQDDLVDRLTLNLTKDQLEDYVLHLIKQFYSTNAQGHEYQSAEFVQYSIVCELKHIYETTPHASINHVILKFVYLHAFYRATSPTSPDRFTTDPADSVVLCSVPTVDLTDNLRARFHAIFQKLIEQFPRASPDPQSKSRPSRLVNPTQAREVTLQWLKPLLDWDDGTLSHTPHELFPLDPQIDLSLLSDAKAQSDHLRRQLELNVDSSQAVKFFYPVSIHAAILLLQYPSTILPACDDLKTVVNHLMSQEDQQSTIPLSRLTVALLANPNQACLFLVEQLWNHLNQQVAPEAFDILLKTMLTVATDDDDDSDSDSSICSDSDRLDDGSDADDSNANSDSEPVESHDAEEDAAECGNELEPPVPKSKTNRPSESESDASDDSDSNHSSFDSLSTDASHSSPSHARDDSDDDSASDDEEDSEDIVLNDEQMFALDRGLSSAFRAFRAKKELERDRKNNAERIIDHQLRLSAVIESFFISNPLHPFFWSFLDNVADWLHQHQEKQLKRLADRIHALLTRLTTSKTRPSTIADDHFSTALTLLDKYYRLFRKPSTPRKAIINVVLFLQRALLSQQSNQVARQAICTNFRDMLLFYAKSNPKVTSNCNLYLQVFSEVMQRSPSISWDLVKGLDKIVADSQNAYKRTHIVLTLYPVLLTEHQIKQHSTEAVTVLREFQNAVLTCFRDSKVALPWRSRLVTTVQSVFTVSSRVFEQADLFEIWDVDTIKEELAPRQKDQKYNKTYRCLVGCFESSKKDKPVKPNTQSLKKQKRKNKASPELNAKRPKPNQHIE